jgi:hypothetical protein
MVHSSEAVSEPFHLQWCHSAHEPCTSTTCSGPEQFADHQSSSQRGSQRTSVICLVGQAGSSGWCLGQAGLHGTKFFAGWQACQSWHTGAGRLAMCQKKGWLACSVPKSWAGWLAKVAHWGWQACQSWHAGAGRLAMCQKVGLAGLQCAKKLG